MNSFGELFCNISSVISPLLPTVDYTLSELATELGESIPFVGSYLIYDAFSLLIQVLSVVVAYKVFKLIPARF